MDSLLYSLFSQMPRNYLCPNNLRGKKCLKEQLIQYGSICTSENCEKKNPQHTDKNKEIQLSMVF